LETPQPNEISPPAIEKPLLIKNQDSSSPLDFKSLISTSKKPLLYIDIDIGDEEGKKRITVYPGDDPKKLS